MPTSLDHILAHLTCIGCIGWSLQDRHHGLGDRSAVLFVRRRRKRCITVEDKGSKILQEIHRAKLAVPLRQ